MPALAPSLGLLQQMALLGLQINLILAIFNLIPIPPLDGSHVLYHLLPPQLGLRYREVGRYGMLILLGLVFFAPGFFNVLYIPVLVLMELAQAFVRLWT
jgi:Zn-dependent protease